MASSRSFATIAPTGSRDVAPVAGSANHALAGAPEGGYLGNDGEGAFDGFRNGYNETAIDAARAKGHGPIVQFLEREAQAMARGRHGPADG